MWSVPAPAVALSPDDPPLRAALEAALGARLCPDGPVPPGAVRLRAGLGPGRVVAGLVVLPDHADGCDIPTRDALLDGAPGSAAALRFAVGQAALLATATDAAAIQLRALVGEALAAAALNPAATAGSTLELLRESPLAAAPDLRLLLDEAEMAFARVVEVLSLFGAAPDAAPAPDEPIALGPLLDEARSIAAAGGPPPPVDGFADGELHAPRAGLLWALSGALAAAAPARLRLAPADGLLTLTLVDPRPSPAWPAAIAALARVGVAVADGPAPVLSFAAAPTAERPRLRLLLVDNEPEILRILARTLRAHEVHAAHGAEEALGLVRGGLRPDAVLSDLSMPGMDGADLVAALRAEAPDVAARVIICTGGPATARLSRFLGDFRGPIVHKPFGVAELYAALDQLPAPRPSG